MAGWPTTLRVRDDGRIVHEIEFLGKLALLRKRLLSKPNAKNVLSAKEADYHSYNCYAFALLASSGVDVPLAAGAKWTLIDRFLNSERIQATLKPQAWSTPIRSGTETRMGDFVFFSQVFGGKYDVDAAASFLVHVHGPDGNASIFSPDPIMQKARSYRYWRLLNPRIFAPKT